MSTSDLILEIISFIGMGAFAVSGALLAVRKQFDVVGMVVLATITTLGGGIIRDVLLGDTPPEAFRHTWWLVVPLIATTLTFFFHPQLSRLRRAVVVFDAVGLGVFAASGTVKAVSFGLDPLAAVMLGTVTGIGGGILRDVLAGEIPTVLRRDSQFYAIPTVFGCVVVVVALELGANRVWTLFGAAVLITGIRLLAVWRRWRGPVPRTSLR